MRQNVHFMKSSQAVYMQKRFEKILISMQVFVCAHNVTDSCALISLAKSYDCLFSPNNINTMLCTR